MGDIALSTATQNVLTLLQRTAFLTNQTNERLATGLKVNRAADDAPAFLLAQSLNARAGDLLALKDGIGQGASTLGSALNGIDAISGLANQLKGIAAAARGGTPAERAAAAAQFDEFLSQIDNLAGDVSFNGINLLSSPPGNLTVAFNEQGSSSLTISGVASDSASLGIGGAAGTHNNFASDADIDNAVGQINQAINTLRTTASSLGSNITLLNTRLDFTTNLVNELQTGAGKLINADLNEEAAKLLSLQVRSRLGLISLNIANENQKAVLDLF